jgi:hypothetical protein
MHAHVHVCTRDLHGHQASGLLVECGILVECQFQWGGFAGTHKVGVWGTEFVGSSSSGEGGGGAI